MIQGSPEWLLARCGSLGASSMGDMMARTKSGWSAIRLNLRARLVVERLTGTPSETFTNAAMIHGIETEPRARAAYEWHTDRTVEQIAFVKHPRITFSHASPDGLIDSGGMLEIKCPQSATHLETLLGAKIPRKYVYQMQWQMAVCERDWCDFVSYDPRLPAGEMQLHITRVQRDDALIPDLEKEATIFLADVAETVEKLHALYHSETVQEAAE